MLNYHRHKSIYSILHNGIKIGNANITYDHKAHGDFIAKYELVLFDTVRSTLGYFRLKETNVYDTRKEYDYDQMNSSELFFLAQLNTSWKAVGAETDYLISFELAGHVHTFELMHNENLRTFSIIRMLPLPGSKATVPDTIVVAEPSYEIKCQPHVLDKEIITMVKLSLRSPGSSNVILN